MKQGLNLLKSNENIIQELYSKYSFYEHIHDSFKLFIDLFYIGDNLKFNSYKLNFNDEFIWFGQIYLFKDYIINDESYEAELGCLFEPDKIENEYFMYINSRDHWHFDGFMKIGILHHSDVILIGMQQNNFGEIWRYGTGLLNTQSCKLDNNIFEFMTRLRCEIDYEQLDDLGISVDRLYKNWGEDFWRVRED